MEKKADPAKTVLTITVGFILVYLATKRDWALLVALLVGITGILSTYLSKIITTAWMKLAWLLSFIVPNILMTIIFYLFLFPLSLVSKLFGKRDPLVLKNSKDSMFVNSDKEFGKESFERPW